MTKKDYQLIADALVSVEVNLRCGNYGGFTAEKKQILDVVRNKLNELLFLDERNPRFSTRKFFVYIEKQVEKKICRAVLDGRKLATAQEGLIDYLTTGD